MDRIPVPGAFYRHFKNKLYQIVAVATHSETGEQMVVYQALYGDYKVYVRPLDMFLSLVDREKYPEVKQTYRFERVEPGQSGARCEARPGPGTQPDSEEQPSPGTQSDLLNSTLLNRFLDAHGTEERLAILQAMEGHVGQKEIDCICLALDISLESGREPEEQLKDISRHLKLCQRYDGDRLRRG